MTLPAKGLIQRGANGSKRKKASLNRGEASVRILDNLFKVGVQTLDRGRPQFSFLPPLIPRIDLKTDHHTGDHDDELHSGRQPVLGLERAGQVVEDHRSGPGSVAS